MVERFSPFANPHRPLLGASCEWPGKLASLVIPTSCTSRPPCGSEFLLHCGLFFVWFVRGFHKGERDYRRRNDDRTGAVCKSVTSGCCRPRSLMTMHIEPDHLSSPKYAKCAKSSGGEVPPAFALPRELGRWSPPNSVHAAPRSFLIACDSTSTSRASSRVGVPDMP